LIAVIAGTLWLLSFCLTGAYHALWGPLGLIAQFVNSHQPDTALLGQIKVSILLIRTCAVSNKRQERKSAPP
jgi:hypothetical protein